MKQEDKELLLKDLCGRIPYGVKVIVPCLGDKIYTLKAVRIEDGCIVVCEMGDNGEISMPIECVKPYLFPLSSMNEEQSKEHYKLSGIYIRPIGYNSVDIDVYDSIYIASSIDYLSKNHFDYRGLIEKSLANDATGLGIYKEE